MELTPDDFNPRVVPVFLKAEEAFDLRPQLKRITAPVLLLQGRQDLAAEANISEAHALIKNSTLIFLDKCGHLPWLEQPKVNLENRERIPRSAPVSALRLVGNPAC
jgi:pimeloyl-ACP methyl ester carboxylesterase